LIEDQQVYKEGWDMSATRLIIGSTQVYMTNNGGCLCGAVN